jgi:hypothetical protein
LTSRALFRAFLLLGFFVFFGFFPTTVLETQLKRCVYAFQQASCLLAVQHKPCKHQVAWLLALAPPEGQDKAERLVLHGLGTLLCFAGGCSMEDITDLSDGLKKLSVDDQAGAPFPRLIVPQHRVARCSR